MHPYRSAASSAFHPTASRGMWCGAGCCAHRSALCNGHRHSYHVPPTCSGRSRRCGTPQMCVSHAAYRRAMRRRGLHQAVACCTSPAADAEPIAVLQTGQEPSLTPARPTLPAVQITRALLEHLRVRALRAGARRTSCERLRPEPRRTLALLAHGGGNEGSQRAPSDAHVVA